jgi:hypothetical protein
LQAGGFSTSFGFDPGFEYGPDSPFAEPLSGFGFLHPEGGKSSRGVGFSGGVSRDEAQNLIHRNTRFSQNHAGEKDLLHGGSFGRSSAGSMNYTPGEQGSWNTAKEELFSFLNWVIPCFAHVFRLFFLRWTNGLPDRDRRSRVGRKKADLRPELGG